MGSWLLESNDEPICISLKNDVIPGIPLGILAN